MKPKELADKAGVKERIVRRWASNHGVKFRIENMRVVYDFTDEEAQAFLERDTKRGRRWPPKD